jgi:hypothetical protein
MAVVEATPPAASETRRCLQRAKSRLGEFSLVPAVQTQTTRIRYSRFDHRLLLRNPQVHAIPLILWLSLPAVNISIDTLNGARVTCAHVYPGRRDPVYLAGCS